MSRTGLVGLGLGLALSAASTAKATDWVLDRDFSMSTNPNGAWTYGVYLEDGYDSGVYGGYPTGWYVWPGYQNLSPEIGGWCNADWAPTGAIFHNNSDTPLGGPVQWWAPHKVMLHPAANGWLYAPAIRWTAPADMTISVDAAFFGCEETSSDVHVIWNGNMYDGYPNPSYSGTHLLDASITGNYGYAPLGIPATNPGGNYASYTGTINVYAGDTIDFVCGYGGNGYASDLTGVDVTITKLADLSQPNDWVLDRDFTQGANPHRDWAYGVFLEDSMDPSYPDGWILWPAYYYYAGSGGQFGFWGNPYNDLSAGAIFYTNSAIPLGGPVQWWAPHKVLLHPAGVGDRYAPFIRWTAPRDLLISVEALFYGCDETSSDVHVLLNGNMTDGPSYSNSLFDGAVTGNYGYELLGIPPTSPDTNHALYSAVLEVHAGDRLDFVCGYGGNGYASDLTGVDITISIACSALWADLDTDQDVDQDDFGLFQQCFTGSLAVAPLSQRCRCVDRVGEDGTITGDDLAAFLTCWTGPSVQAASCP